MKFSTLAALGGFASLAFATEPECTAAPEKTVTVTVPAGGVTPPAAPTDAYHQVTTISGIVQSIDYGLKITSTKCPSAGVYPHPEKTGSSITVNAPTWWTYQVPQSTILAHPTGVDPNNKQCTKVVYEKGIIVEIKVVIIVNVNGVHSTSTLAEKPSYTPPPPVAGPGSPPSGGSPPATTTGNGVGVHETTRDVYSAAATHKVLVGKDGLTYTPNQLIAKKGDVVEFNFFKQNHTVTQSNFTAPCSKLTGGFNTGFNQFNPENIDGKFIRSIVIDVETPTWFYCAQGNFSPASHCGAGMVLGINPAGKMDAFIANAKAQGATFGASATDAPKKDTVTTPSNTVSATGTKHTVAVGRDGLTFSPNQVTAAKGDIIEFNFFAKNHTVTQSSLDTPCDKIGGGFDTGFNQVNPENIDGKFIVPFEVKDTSKPIWFYCAQGGRTAASHCGQGMVFGLNPGGKMDAFIHNAQLQGEAFKAGSTATTATTATATQSNTVTATGAKHTVAVGRDGLTFSPNQVTAAKGDIIEFNFFAKNHTVTQSTLDTPCFKIGNGGFDTGFNQFNPDGVDGKFIVPFEVKDATKPIWFYCAQGGQTAASHCGAGMVFGLNPAGKMDQFIHNAQLQGASFKTATATSTTVAAPGATSPPAAVTTHKVQVGKNGLTYTPNQLNARTGDVIEFNFFAKNHTVTQSSLLKPCDFLPGGFDTGFNQFNPDNVDGKFIKTLTVQTEAPTWFYCAQGGRTAASHCGAGMVLGVNPAGKMDQFLANAAQQGAVFKNTPAPVAAAPAPPKPLRVRGRAVRA